MLDTAENIVKKYDDVVPLVTIDSKDYYVDDVKGWLKSINETEEALDKPEEDRTTLEELLESLERWDEKQWALFAHKGFEPCYISDISDLDIYRDEEKLDGEYYLVLTDEEADEKYEDYQRDLVEDQLGRGMEWLMNYIDFGAIAKDDCYGRGNTLSGYDGEEHEYDVNGTTYYIYRTN